MTGRAEQAAAALAAQVDAVRDWLSRLDDADLSRQSALGGWQVRELGTHLAHVLTALADPLAAGPRRGTRPLSIAAYTSAYAGAAHEMAARERQAGGALDAAGVLQLFDREWARARAALDAVGASGGRDPVVAARRGAIHVADLVSTRVTELVVHGRDASRSLPDRPAVASPRAAIALAVRMLTGILAERHPGRSVEIRVPPWAAVQVGSDRGAPVHTRGTPPNVVEMDAGTFLDVATGRLAFAAALAAGMVRASGTRADLGGLLPVLC